MLAASESAHEAYLDTLACVASLFNDKKFAKILLAVQNLPKFSGCLVNEKKRFKPNIQKRRTSKDHNLISCFSGFVFQMMHCL